MDLSDFKSLLSELKVSDEVKKVVQGLMPRILGGLQEKLTQSLLEAVTKSFGNMNPMKLASSLSGGDMSDTSSLNGGDGSSTLSDYDVKEGPFDITGSRPLENYIETDKNILDESISDEYFDDDETKSPSHEDDDISDNGSNHSSI